MHTNIETYQQISWNVHSRKCSRTQWHRRTNNYFTEIKVLDTKHPCSNIS